METKLLSELNDVLKGFPEYWIDKKLNRTAVIQDLKEKKLDLLKALINNGIIKSNYVTDIEGVLVFDFEGLVSLIKYKDYWNDSYTDYINQIGLSDNGRFIKNSTDLVLDFPFKDCMLEGGIKSEEEGRNEVFYHETIARDELDRLLSPKVLVNTKLYTQDGVEQDVTEFNENDNLIIKGNNLIALSSLKSRFTGKVKCIYIDPPYYFKKKKKEDTFAYNSNFKLSTWLVFMKNRLELARELLSEDGSIFVQISDDGVAELHMLMKDIFNKGSEDNFLNKITVKTRSPSGFASVNAGVFETAEYIISFAKDKKKWVGNPQYVEAPYDTNYKWFIKNIDDDYKKWEIVSIRDFIAQSKGYKDSKEILKNIDKITFDKMIADFALKNNESVYRLTEIGNDAGKAVVDAREQSKKNPDDILRVERDNQYTVYIHKGQEIAFYSKKVKEIDGKKVPTIQLSNIWMDTPYEGIAKEGGVTLKGGKKPEKLIQRILELASNENDLVLDFFLGSGTTCAVAHKLNRRYIGVEQLDYIQDKTVKRMQSVVQGELSGISKAVNWAGGGSFVYTELLQHNHYYVNKIKEVESSSVLEKVFLEMKDKAHMNFQVDLERVLESKYEVDDIDHKVSFSDLSLNEQKQLMIKLLDLNQLYVCQSEIDDVTYDVSDSDKEFTASFYKKA